ncbi:unnamed protein product [Zymoseptoria tritici ST99CH_3D1]|nr:unnamed protein product [Zymoseptoria tritici ST99CH_3D1]
MLQFINDYLGLQQAPYDDTMPEILPKILVTVATSSDKMSLSGQTPFSITLRAVVEGDRPVTFSTHRTIFWPRNQALFEGGLSFKDVKTGNFAARTRFQVCRMLPDTISASDESVHKLPAQISRAPPYEVTFDFRIEGDSPRSTGHGTGLEIGHEYEIGLGTERSALSWWKMGSKIEVFAAPNQHRSRTVGAGVPELQMIMTNTALFKVVK